MINVGDTVLLTTNEWFFAPDGEQYMAAFGTVHGIYTSEKTLGIKTNARSTNWYVEVGNMTIAGCQIHYVIKTESFNPNPVLREIESNGKIEFSLNAKTRIYNADGEIK